MKRLITAAALVLTLGLVGTAAATLVPGVYDPGHTGCPTATFTGGVLHLAKNCATTTNASAGADITGLGGHSFTSASFTLANVGQCQGGSPRFNITSSNGTTYFLGCNNVKPTLNADGTATYTFDAATIAAGGNQVPLPAGTITSAGIVLDVQGTADLSRIFVNGTAQEPVANGGGAGKGHHGKRCPHGRNNGHDCGEHTGQKGGKHQEHHANSPAKNDDNQGNSQGHDNDSD
jgi:hypothetical protein